MAEARTGATDRLRERRWSFAGFVFDEANWSLTGADGRIAIETKPLELLRKLLVGAGRVVSKDELLDGIWPEVIVVEASLPTAVYKLRVALGDDGGKPRIVETVPGLGYRLAVPVDVEEVGAAADKADAAAPGEPGRPDAAGRAVRTGLRHRRAGSMLRLSLVAAMLAIVATGILFLISRPDNVSATNAPRPVSKRDAENAIRRLDVPAIERMLAAGWDPNAPAGHEGNAALHYAVEMCEWNPGHDQDRLLLLVRTIYEGGGRLDLRNRWGDTPYSIAKSPRYCGPAHPVTMSLRATCTGSRQREEDHCLAAYEVARRNRR